MGFPVIPALAAGALGFLFLRKTKADEPYKFDPNEWIATEPTETSAGELIFIGKPERDPFQGLPSDTPNKFGFASEYEVIQALRKQISDGLILKEKFYVTDVNTRLKELAAEYNELLAEADKSKALDVGDAFTADLYYSAAGITAKTYGWNYAAPVSDVANDLANAGSTTNNVNPETGTQQTELNVTNATNAAMNGQTGTPVFFQGRRRIL